MVADGGDGDDAGRYSVDFQPRRSRPSTRPTCGLRPLKNEQSII